MSKNRQEQIMMLISIIGRGKGKAYMEMLSEKKIQLHMQCVGTGTASSEMMDILGLGSNLKDIIISYAPRKNVEILATDLSKDLSTSMGFGGLMMIMSTSAISRLMSEVLIHQSADNEVKGDENAMKSEYKHSLIFITVNQGYTENVMHTARKAGATGGTVIRARMSGAEQAEELMNLQIQDEKEIVMILAPDSVRNQIMEEVNKEYGLRSEAKGVVCSVPVDKAFKI